MAASFCKTLCKTLNPQRISFLKIPTKRSPKPMPISERTLSSLSNHSQENERGRWSKWLLFLPGAITFGLGSWQILRRQEKIQMLDYRRKRLELEPVAWNSTNASTDDLDSLEFRRVICEGVFDESKSIYIGPRSRSISGVTENGYFVITPLVPIADKPDSVQLPILVNRGWVPRSWRDNHLLDRQNDEKPLDMTLPVIEEHKGTSWWQFWHRKPKPSKVEQRDVSPLKVIGVIRGSEKPNIFVPANDPSSGQWFFVDVQDIARACGLPETTVYIEDINENTSASHPYPVPKDVNSLIRYSVMPQDHLNYTLTWYALSAAVTFMAVKRVKPKKTQR